MKLIDKLQKKLSQNRKLVTMFAFGLVGVIMLSATLALDNKGPYKGIWLTSDELFALPTEGPAWENIVKRANNGDIGEPNLADQDSYHSNKLLAVAMVAARNQDDRLKEKVATDLVAMIGTEEAGRTLSLGRQLATYVIAADLINFPEYDAQREATFSKWLSDVRTKHIGNHGRWVNLTQTHENSASNWGAFAGASRVAASIYLGDTADVERSANIFRALGDRSYYPKDLPWGDYFQSQRDVDYNWSCRSEANWIAINESGCKSNGYDVGGAPIVDISRELDDVVVLPQAEDSLGVMYSWGALHGFTTQAELLHRAGYDAWDWNDQMMRRTMEFIERAGWHRIYSTQTPIPWLVNSRYGTDFSTEPVTGGRSYAWTDWTHATFLGLEHGNDTDPPTVDVTPPTVLITSPSDGQDVSGLVTVSVNASDDIGVDKVVFSLDGDPIAVDSTSPYSITVDTTAYGNGTHIIMATATDTAGNQANSSVNVSFDNQVSQKDTDPPVITVNSPVDGSTYTKKVEFDVSVADVSPVTDITVFVDGKQIASTSGESLTTRYNINGKNISLGEHQVLIEATDSAGNKSRLELVFYKK